MKQTLKKIPDSIYLQLHGDSECVDRFEEISLEDATWSQERIYPTDVEYTRRKSPWININERLPDNQNEVLVLSRMNRSGRYFVAEDSYDGKEWAVSSAMHYTRVAWMPIPSFDEILEANRDVLERIKENGD